MHLVDRPHFVRPYPSHGSGAGFGCGAAHYAVIWMTGGTILNHCFLNDNIYFAPHKYSDASDIEGKQEDDYGAQGAVRRAVAIKVVEIDAQPDRGQELK